MPNPGFLDLTEPARKSKPIRTAYKSNTFDQDGTIHVDGLVGSASISPSGRDVALASPEGLAIIDLDSPYSPPRRLASHGHPWLVVDVQWSPFAARDYWVASTANHNCLIWNLNLRDDSANGAIEHSLQGHSRAITDINFSAHHADTLATCSVDGYVHQWDLRRPRQPVLTFCDWFAGATQVKFNRQDQHILASSHDRWLHIWDERKAAAPLKTISAHTSKIYGIDWNRTRSTGIVTCSLDKSIKFWDYGNDNDTPERVIRTEFPVWRARHTPFGWGLLAMPQNEPGNLYLYDRRSDANTPLDAPIEPIAVFPGHSDHKVKEFLWRVRGSVNDGHDERDFQLVSWGEDNELRLQLPDSQHLEAVGFVKGGPARKKMNITRKGATYKTFRTVDDTSLRDLRNPTMSDPRPPAAAYRRSGIPAGVQGSNPHYHRPGAMWRGPSMKATRSSRKKIDRSLAHIGWMKGVSMTKRKSSTPQRSMSKDSSMFSPQYDDKWGEPETVQDEFIRVTHRLPNVVWETIDMDNLSLVATLKGPWGASGGPIFIRVKVDIPSTYPKSKAPKFSIERTVSMAEETHQKLDQELHELTHRFLKRKQNCLDVAFTYLLGEVDLENSTSFFKNVSDLADDLAGLVDESSSEDEDNDNIHGSTSMSQELIQSMESDNALVPVNRTIGSIPPPLCGGRFSNDGRLVCFFPTKEKARPFLFPQPNTYRERPKDEPSFAGFGKIQQEAPVPRRVEDASATEEGGSDGSDESDGSSSSDSESAANIKTSVWFQPSAARRFRKTWSESQSLRSSGGGTGVGTGTGTGTSRRRGPGKPKNTISIHNVEGLIPSRREFAKHYAIFGDGAEVCQHNAKVARDHGCPYLGNVWEYCSLLLRKDIPLELLHSNQRRSSVLVIAKHVVSVSRGRDPSLLASGGAAGALMQPTSDFSLTGRVKWGHHPLATDCIHDLFDYYGKTGDIQMLAMLSCIFSESSTEDSIAYADAQLSQPETPLPMKAPAFSLDYYPATATTWSRQQKSHFSSAITTPRIAHTPLRLSGSPHSEEYWTEDPGSNSYSCGETPPRRSGPRDYMAEPDHPYTQSPSTSPDARSLRRANSATATAFASLPRPFSNMMSSSPPGTRKRPSPAETIFSNLAPAWGGAPTVANAHAPAVDHGPTSRNSISDDEARRLERDDQLPLVPVGVSITMEDQTSFDDDGWMNTPLLQPDDGLLYASYRFAYAEMLQMWGFPLNRLEILKFNVMKQDIYGAGESEANGDSFDTVTQTEFDTHAGTVVGSVPGSVTGHGHGHSHPLPPSPTSPMLLGKREQLLALSASGRGLDVTGICRVHETKLRPVLYGSGSSAATVSGGTPTASPPPNNRRPFVGGSGGATSHPRPASSSAVIESVMAAADGVWGAEGAGLLGPRGAGGKHPAAQTTSYSASNSGVGGAVGICDRCHGQRQTQLVCVYCLEPADSLFVACLGCGCVTHEGCLAEWHGMGETGCPAGDECECVHDAMNAVVESWEGLRAQLALQKKAKGKGMGRQESAQDKLLGMVGGLQQGRRGGGSGSGAGKRRSFEIVEGGGPGNLRRVRTGGTVGGLPFSPSISISSVDDDNDKDDDLGDSNLDFMPPRAPRNSISLVGDEFAVDEQDEDDEDDDDEDGEVASDGNGRRGVRYFQQQHGRKGSLTAGGGEEWQSVSAGDLAIGNAGAARGMFSGVGTSAATMLGAGGWMGGGGGWTGGSGGSAGPSGTGPGPGPGAGMTSMARLSLGNRLRRAGEQMTQQIASAGGRPGMLRRKSGGAEVWRRGGPSGGGGL